MCSGYYTSAEGYMPEFPGTERFAGRIVHPQKWTADIDYVGKRVVVIGSGATAVTLLPEVAKQAAHVTSRCCSARRRTSSPYRRKTESRMGSATTCLTAPLTASRAGKT